VAQTSDLDRVASIVLRFMRGPLLLLLIVYAIGIIGMVLVPGQDAEGNPTHMSLFHAFYFFTYTATTTGFGEIPNAFTESQRLWAVVCLYMGVIAWIYAIGSIIRLAQNPHFVQAVAERRFARSVRRITEPFFIVCGFGDTGSLLARGLSDQYCRGIIIDSDPERIKALGLRDYHVKMLGLCADASVPKHLFDAGIRLPNCRGVVALTNNEHINLKIAVMTRYLNPDAQIICRSTSLRHQEELAMLESVIVVDPFKIFAHQLGVALYAPLLHTFSDWLVGAREASLDNPPKPPTGQWILCGYGRMGKRLHDSLRQREIPMVVIEPKAETVEEEEIEQLIVGHTTLRTLQRAGIEQAVGLVVGTNSDSDNLSIMLRARSLNPNLFFVVRQNHHENEVAFNAAHANLIMQPSLVTARKILLMLIAPMLQTFLEHLETHHVILLGELVYRLQENIGDGKPELWTVVVTETTAPAVVDLHRQGYTVTLEAIHRHPVNREKTLDCVPLAHKRGDGYTMLPPWSQRLEPGDELLICGTKQAEGLLEATLNNIYTLHYILTGAEMPRGHLFRWLFQKKDLLKSG
jgi:Trk K+ transport system NAD-binding subunit